MGLLGSEPDNLRDEIAAAFDAPDTSPAEPVSSDAATVTTQPAEAAGKTGAAAETTPATDERPRGPDGKFVPKEAAAPAPKSIDTAAKAPEKVAIPAAPKQPSTDTTKASETQPSTAADAPPVGWTAEAKAEWASLSPAIKAAVFKREAEISSGGRQWSDQKRHYEETLAPVAAAASRRGLQPAQAIQQLMAAQDYLDRDAANAIAWLAKSYGVDITVNGKQPNGAPTADGSSRMDFGQALTPLQRQIEAINARFAQEDRRQTEVTQQNVERFASDPTHPHFDAVADEIMVWIPHVKAQNPYGTPDQILQEAYDRAVHGNPTTRAALQQERLAAELRDRRQTNGAEVAKARLAASSVHGGPTGLPASGPKETIREELEAAFAGLR